MTITDIVWFFVLLSLSAFVSHKTGRALGLRDRLSFILFVWHTAFCISYWILSQNQPADSNSYYDAALNGYFNWSPGTSFVISFTSILVSGLGLGKLNTFLVFNVFGVSGLLLLANVFLSLWPYRRGWHSNIPYFILLLPGLSFWSSALGKDAPAFFAACLASYAFIDLSNRKIHFALAVLLIFTVRPHVACFMLLAAGLALLSEFKIGLSARLFLFSIVITASFFVIPFAINYASLGDEISYETVGDYIEKRQGYNMEGGGGVDISTQPLPQKMFTYLFRPLFLDAHGWLGFIVSLENLFLFTLFFIYFGKGLFYSLRDSSIQIRYNLFYFFIGLFVFSMTSANLGISIRQKTMILPSSFVIMALAANHLWLNNIARLQRSVSRRIRLRGDSA